MYELLPVAAAMLLAGAGAGILAGLFGIGGGVVLVPAMELALATFGVDAAIRMQIAVATSLAVIVPTSIASARSHHQRKSVDVELVKRWWVPVLLGSLAGAWIASIVHGRVLSGLFAAFAIVVAWRILAVPQPVAKTNEVPRGAAVSLIPASIGTMSSMLGIGGGTVFVMVLTMFGHSIHRAVGTASLFGFAISLPGTLGFMALGWGDERLPPLTLGYVSLVGLAIIASTTVLAAPLGAHIAHKLKASTLRRAFGAFLVIAALRMGHQAFYG